MPKFSLVRDSKSLSGLFRCAFHLAMLGSLSAGEKTSLPLSQSAIQQRAASITNADEALLLGDQAYAAGKFEEAFQHYLRGFKQLPNAPIAQPRADALRSRISQSGTYVARQQAKSGDYEKADATLKIVLAPNVSPTDPEALKLQAEVRDPERFNPALNPSHLEDVKEVNRLLIKANGFIDLGRYDEGIKELDAVLRIDPYNTAARRMMERAINHKSAYLSASYDENRSKLLSSIEEAWKNPRNIISADLLADPNPSDEQIIEDVILKRMNGTVLERVELKDETLQNVLSFLEQETDKINGQGNGIRFTTSFGDANGEIARSIESRKISLNIKNVPLPEILKLISNQCGIEILPGPYSYRVIPAGKDTGYITSRSFTVSPTFFFGKTSEESKESLFSGSNKTTKLEVRRDAATILKEAGVPFPEGSSVTYDPVGGTLMAKNTEANLRLIEEIIRGSIRSTPTQILLTSTFVEINQDDLEELGYDWLLEPTTLNSGNNNFIGGGTQGNGNNIIGNVPTTNFGTTSNPSQGAVTSGLRSGQTAFTFDPLNSLIATGASNFGGSSERSPTALAFRGLFTDSDFMALMRGMNQKKAADILLRPSIICRPGETASLFSGREFYYATEYEPPQLPNAVGNTGGGAFPVTPSHPTAFEKRDIGISFEVEAQVTEDSPFISLRLAPEFVDFIGYVNYGSPIKASGTDALGNPLELTLTENQILMPIFRTRRLNTSIDIADGATICVGGLQRDSRQIVNDKVPILGDLPMIGRFFQTQGIQRERRVVLIFVKAQMIDPAGNPLFDSTIQR